MSSNKEVHTSNPIDNVDVARWRQDRQSDLWERVREQTDGDGSLIIGKIDFVSKQRGIRMLLVAAVLLPLLMGGLVLVQQSGTADKSDIAVEPTVTSAPYVGRVPDTIELSTSGGIWAADASLNREQAARAFAREAFGWDEGVDVTTEEAPGGPSWTSISKGSTTVDAVFWQIGTSPGGWTVMQVGRWGSSLSVLSAEDSPQHLVISKTPKNTSTMLVHSAHVDGGVSRVVEELDSMNMEVELGDWPVAALVVFLDSSGQVIKALGSEFGPSDANEFASAAIIEAEIVEPIFQLVERDGKHWIDYGALVAPDGTEQLRLEVNGEFRAGAKYQPDISGGLAIADLPSDVDVVVVAIYGDSLKLARSPEQHLWLPMEVEPVGYTADEADVEAVLSEYADAAGAHLPGWRPSLDSESAWCIYEDFSGIQTAVTEFPLNQAMTMTDLMTECTVGNDVVRGRAVTPDNFTVCQGSYNESSYREMLDTGLTVIVESSGERPFFPVVLGWKTDCATAVLETSLDVTLTTFESFDEVNRVRAIEIDVRAESVRRCVSRSEVGSLAAQTLQRLGGGWQIVEFGGGGAGGESCYKVEVHAEFGFLAVVADDTEPPDQS